MAVQNSTWRLDPASRGLRKLFRSQGGHVLKWHFRVMGKRRLSPEGRLGEDPWRTPGWGTIPRVWVTQEAFPASNTSAGWEFKAATDQWLESLTFFSLRNRSVYFRHPVCIPRPYSRHAGQSIQWVVEWWPPRRSVHIPLSRTWEHDLIWEKKKGGDLCSYN